MPYTKRIPVHTVEHCQSGRTERDISRAEKARQQSEPDSQEAE